MGPSRGRDIVVMAASAGGIEPLRAILSRLPADLPASIFVVVHVPAHGGRVLPRILDRAGPLPAAPATDGEPVRRGRVYVARPDRHLLVRGGAVGLSLDPPLRGLRPAADPLFRGAALTCGPRVLAVVVSGALDDGAAGCAAVEQHGGMVAVQDPAECDHDGMPRAALAAARHAVALPASGLAAFIEKHAAEPPGNAVMRMLSEH